MNIEDQLTSLLLQLSPRRRQAVRATSDAAGQVEPSRRGPVGVSRQQSSTRDIDISSMPDIGSLRSVATRTQWSTITRATVLLALILIPSLSSAAIYKCTAQDGAITYTDVPCPADTTTQTIDPAAPSWLNEPSQNTTPTFPVAKSQSQPEFIASLCANDDFKVWLKAQHSLPERDARAAKFAKISNLCRRALHLPDVAAPIAQAP